MDRKEARDVMTLLDAGLAPSQIDKEMGLTPGTARRTISDWWKSKRFDNQPERRPRCS